MINTTLCYSATSGSSVADYGTPCTVDMGNVGSEFASKKGAIAFTEVGTKHTMPNLGIYFSFLEPIPTLTRC